MSVFDELKSQAREEMLKKALCQLAEEVRELQELVVDWKEEQEEQRQAMRPNNPAPNYPEICPDCRHARRWHLKGEGCTWNENSTSAPNKQCACKHYEPSQEATK